MSTFSERDREVNLGQSRGRCLYRPMFPEHPGLLVLQSKLVASTLSSFANNVDND